MKTFLFFVCIVCLIGCSPVQQQNVTVTQPELLEQTALPPITGSMFKSNFRLNIRMLIDEEGQVLKARFIDGSGYQEWDSIALESIAKWRFTPARIDQKPVKIWVNQLAYVRIQEPVYFSISEILCPNLDIATKVFDSLQKGGDFAELAYKYSISQSREIKGYLGKVDINLYMFSIREYITKLKDNEYSRPIKYGEKYIIFKKNPMTADFSFVPVQNR